MIGIGIIPHRATPFRDSHSGELDLTLRMVALCPADCPELISQPLQLSLLFQLMVVREVSAGAM